MKMSPVVHFEMPAEDRDRMSKFYSQVFGWQTQQMGNYVVVTTADTDPETRMVKTPGTINGGFYQKDPSDEGKRHPSVVISVENIEESMQQIKDAGGTITHGPDDIPGVGKYASFKDTEGNTVSILQPSVR
jgi:predicted enzyme related to lactoylglutathione lyase